MSHFRMKFTVELLEDMHCGSGSGRLGIVDDLHARDRYGRPVVRASTLSGLLRERAEELRRLYALAGNAEKSEGTAKRLEKIFGHEGQGGRSRIICRSLHFERGDLPTDGSIFHELTATSREPLSRKPLERTLRKIEVASAGQNACGEIILTGDEDDKSLILTCLKRLESLGGSKTRGMGRIRVNPNEISVHPIESGDINIRPVSSSCLRLVLKTLESVCIPKSSFAGNQIDTRSYIPGQAMRGAILTALNDICPEYANKLAAKNVSFGNAYCIPSSLAEKGEVFPLPLTAEEPKTNEREGQEPSLPWWAAVSSGRKIYDTLLKKSDPAKNMKRIKSDMYIYCADKASYYCQPLISTTLHNRIPVHRAAMEQDSRRPDADPESLQSEKGALFSISSISEDQYFISDIYFPESKDADDFIKSLGPIYHESAKGKIPLRVGRGGRPVEICNIVPITLSSKCGDIETLTLKGHRNGASKSCPGFCLTLTSDLILRKPSLDFVSEPVIDDFCRVMKVDKIQAQIDKEFSVFETVRVHGFNTAAGARRSSAIAIKAGSAFLFVAEKAEPLKPLFERLAECLKTGKGIGERTEEGFGRFVLNHRFHRSDKPITFYKGANEHEDDEIQRKRLGEIEFKNKILKDVLDKKKIIEQIVQGPKYPSRSQWQAFRHDLEVLSPEKENLENFFCKLKGNSKKPSGSAWQEKLKPDENLLEYLEKFHPRCDPKIARYFLINFSRLVIIGLSDKRKKEFGGKVQEECEYDN